MVGRDGRSAAAMTAPARATPPATRQPPARLWRNAPTAAVARPWAGTSCPAWRRVWAATRAPPTDPLAASAARVGRLAGMVARRRVEYREAATLPITATPSAAPNRRVAS